MGKKNTGLSNMPDSNNELATNRDLEQPRAEEDSDSELDENGTFGGYMPLAQNPGDSEALYESTNDSDDETLQPSSGTMQGQEVELSASIVEEVWAQPAPKEVDIEMGEKKIDLVKQMMLSIQLPEEAIPDWARNVPEAQWKDHLVQKLQQLQ